MWTNFMTAKRRVLLGAAALACFLYPGFAAAEVIDGEVTWEDRTAIHERPDGGVEVTGTGKLIANARVDINSPGFLTIRSGGVVEFNDTFKFPDNDEGAPGPTIHIESGGMMTVGDTESILARIYDGGIFLAPDAVYETGMISLGDRRDPRSAEWKIEPWVEMGATGIDITVDGEIATVRGIPEPSSICLLGLGSLMLLRLRRGR